MKWLWLVGIVGILLLLGGGYWWWGKRASQPLEFKNATLETSLDTGQFLSNDMSLVEEEEKNTQVTAGLPNTEVTPSKDTSPPVTAPVASPSPSPVTVYDRLIGFGFRTPTTQRTVNAIVLHSSYNASGGEVYNLDKIIGQYEQYGVGAHYLIDRNGKIYRLIQEESIAYHAGESKMPDGRKNVNDFSIGIELMGTEDSGFTGKQYDALNDLIADIKTRYRIKDIVGHGDVAPKRKTDPWKFDWKKLE